jgi:hypothetical protein
VIWPVAGWACVKPDEKQNAKATPMPAMWVQMQVRVDFMVVPDYRTMSGLYAIWQIT